MHEETNITHSNDRKKLSEAIKTLTERIVSRGNLPHISVKTQLDLVKQLKNFPLGQHMLKNQGVNGYWTDYIISSAEGIKEFNHNSCCELSELEDYILNRFPLTLATRERFKIFQSQIQNKLKNNMVLASIPCGCMRDLLSLNYSNFSNIQIIGIDIDPESLKLAGQLASNKGLERSVHFLERDAWNLCFENAIDLITSNGLNVYEPNREKVIALYKEFFKALKCNGTLIIGVLTFPPGKNKQTDWILENVNMDDFLVEKMVFEDVLSSKWQNYRSTEEICDDFHTAGFKNVSIIFDKRHIFPTVIAEKS